MAFGVATVVTNKYKAIIADRIRTTPATYTNSPKYVGIGTGATGAARTAVAADTALSTEVETRVAGTESVVTTSVTGDTYQTQATISITGTRAIDEAMTNDAVSSGNIGMSATMNVINLISGDSLQLTCKTQFS